MKKKTFTDRILIKNIVETIYTGTETIARVQTNIFRENIYIK